MTVTCRETPFFTVERASESFVGSTEGCVKGGLFGTELCGPLLVRNPAVLDYYAARLAKKELPPCTSAWYRFAREGYDRLLAKLQSDPAMKTR